MRYFFYARRRFCPKCHTVVQKTDAFVCLLLTIFFPIGIVFLCVSRHRRKVNSFGEKILTCQHCGTLIALSRGKTRKVLSADKLYYIVANKGIACSAAALETLDANSISFCREDLSDCPFAEKVGILFSDGRQNFLVTVFCNRGEIFLRYDDIVLPYTLNKLMALVLALFSSDVASNSASSPQDFFV